MSKTIIWILAALSLSNPASANLLEDLIQNSVKIFNNTAADIAHRIQTMTDITNNATQQTATSLSTALAEIAEYAQAMAETAENIAKLALGTIGGTVTDALEGNLTEALASGTVIPEILRNALYVAASDSSDDTQTVTVTSISNQCATVKSVLRIIGEQLSRNGNEPDVSKLTLDYITGNSFETYNLTTAAEEIPKSRWFVPGQGIVVYAHGFTDSANGSNAINVTDALFSRGVTNIVALNSSSLIGGYYIRSTRYVQYIGEALGRFLYAMYQAGIDPSSMYLVGHSLGAHICGFAGKMFTNLSGYKIPRITGLDPAGPCFTNLSSSLRLNRSDADFVDVIHTNAGVFGLDEDVGHVDYFPNGGSSQPGCSLADCSHGRVIFLFSESVLSNTSFPAVACDSWSDFRDGNGNYSDTSYVGYGSSNSTRGTYFLQTASTSPYSLGEGGTTYTSA